MSKTRLSNDRFPGFTGETTLTLGDELARVQVLDPAENYLGEIVYVRRRHSDGTSTYGWRRARASANSRLHSKVDAVADLVINGGRA